MSAEPQGGVGGRIAGVVLALLLTGSVVGLSQAPYTVESDDAARVRLSWRFRASVEECRELSEEELADLPAHMRRPVVCERRVPPHRLRVEVDGRSVLDEVIRAAGAQRDRPLYVFREITVAPGLHRVRIGFARVDGGGEAREDADALSLETTLDLGPREVGLIVYDADAGVLRRVGGTGEASGRR